MKTKIKTLTIIFYIFSLIFFLIYKHNVLPFNNTCFPEQYSLEIGLYGFVIMAFLGLILSLFYTNGVELRISLCLVIPTIFLFSRSCTDKSLPYKQNNSIDIYKIIKVTCIGKNLHSKVATSSYRFYDNKRTYYGGSFIGKSNYDSISIGDTMLVKYVFACPYIDIIYKLNPTESELKKYNTPYFLYNNKEYEKYDDIPLEGRLETKRNFGRDSCGCEETPWWAFTSK